MSVSNIMNNGLSALTASQTALRVTANNVANVNTEGYVRQDTHMTSVSISGIGNGVSATIQRAADTYLATTHLQSISSASQYSVTAGLMDRAQAALGDPSGETSIFAGMDVIMTKAATLAGDPSSSLYQSDLISSMETAFEDVQTAFSTINNLRDEANTKLGSALESANLIMSNIATLNTEIQKLTVSGSNASALENEQDQLMNDLAELIDFKIIKKDLGGVELRTTSGMLLVDHGAATLSFSESGTGSRYEGVSITPPGASSLVDISDQIKGGEIRGLMNARDAELPEVAYALGEYASALATALNNAANEGTASPAPTSLDGRNTGLVSTDSLGFTGAAMFAVVDSSGRTVDTVTVDFDAGTATNAAGTVSAIGTNIGSFVSALNTSFGGNASVSFTDGTLSFSATGTNGVAIAQDGSNPSDRAGRGVSAFFGMNDVITSFSPSNYSLGVSGSDTHEITSGSLTFGIRDENGNIIDNVEYTPTSGDTFDDLINDLNSTNVLGYYATASLDSNGRLVLTPKTNSGTAIVDVLSDDTQRASTGLSLTNIFGLGFDAPADRARSLKVDTQLTLNSSLLPSNGFNTNATNVGDLAVAAGDNTGGLALQEALSQKVSYYSSSGTLLANMAVSDIAAEIASDAGTRAAYLEGRADAALALQDEAALRRSSVEGVNLDEEMVRMTTYQQSYAAASRLITAARDMYDTLLSMV